MNANQHGAGPAGRHNSGPERASTESRLPRFHQGPLSESNRAVGFHQPSTTTKETNMSKILVVAETSGGRLKKTTHSAITFARNHAGEVLALQCAAARAPSITAALSYDQTGLSCQQ